MLKPPMSLHWGLYIPPIHLGVSTKQPMVARLGLGYLRRLANTEMQGLLRSSWTAKTPSIFLQRFGIERGEPGISKGTDRAVAFGRARMEAKIGRISQRERGFLNPNTPAGLAWPGMLPMKYSMLWSTTKCRSKPKKTPRKSKLMSPRDSKKWPCMNFHNWTRRCFRTIWKTTIFQKKPPQKLFSHR